MTRKGPERKERLLRNVAGRQRERDWPSPFRVGDARLIGSFSREAVNILLCRRLSVQREKVMRKVRARVRKNSFDLPMTVVHQAQFQAPGAERIEGVEIKV